MNHYEDRSEAGLLPYEKVLIWTLFPAGGLILGWFLPAIAKWAGSLPWTPFQGPFRLIASIEAVWAVSLSAVICGFIGLWISDFIIKNCLFISVSDSDIHLAVKNNKTIVRRKEISACFMDGKYLVLLGREQQELFKGQPEGSRERLSDAFIRHGYPWMESDPLQNEYRLWVSGSTDLEPAVHSILNMRHKALKDDEETLAENLKRELMALGVVVRDEGDVQYWRKITVKTSKTES